MTYADLDTLPAYVEHDIDMLNEALNAQETPSGKLDEKLAREYAARITEQKATT